jgi:long-chain acyl-CoA synthetase
MVAYAYDLINTRQSGRLLRHGLRARRHERRARAAPPPTSIQQALGLPNKAFSYLRSHGTLDQEHTKHLAALLEQMTPEDQADVLHAAKVFYKLYGDVFRALPTAKETPCN